MTCTNKDCTRQTSLYLCTTCIIELDDLLQQVPKLVAALDPSILAWSVTKQPGANGETRNTNKAGSQAPYNIDVDQLRSWLAGLVGLRAHDIAANYPTAEQYLFMARMWVDRANSVTHGPDIPEINHEGNTARVKEIAPPMTTRQLLPWLRANARIAITSMDIRNWARRGHLNPVEREPSPTYHPHEVIEAWHERNSL